MSTNEAIAVHNHLCIAIASVFACSTSTSMFTDYLSMYMNRVAMLSIDVLCHLLLRRV